MSDQKKQIDELIELAGDMPFPVGFARHVYNKAVDNHMRERMKLAAKAAGIGDLDFDYATREGHGFYFGPRRTTKQSCGLQAMIHSYWHPLDNGSDSQHLQAKLSMDIICSEDREGEYWQSHALCRVTFNTQGARVYFKPDDCLKALRQAIFDTAVAIGREMP